MTRIDRLERAATAGDWLHGAPLIRQLLKELQAEGGPTESELEALARDIFKDAGLSPTKQHRVVLQGRLRRLDFLFPAEKIVVEADGYETHSSPEAFNDDRARNNALVARGFRVLHWTWAQVKHQPDELLAQLQATLALVRRGAA